MNGESKNILSTELSPQLDADLDVVMTNWLNQKNRQQVRFQIDTDGTLLTNIESYYKLEDATDSLSVHAFTLTNNNSVAFNPAKVNNGADGGSGNTNKYLVTGHNLGIDGGSCSISCWVNITTQIGSGTYTFVEQNIANSTEVGYTIRYEYNGGTRRLAWVRERIGVADDAVYETITLSTGTWYHLILTYDGATVQAWRDGASKGTVSSSGNGSSAGTTGFSVLANTAGSNLVSGLVDEAGLWSKKLSNQEVADLYNSGNGQTVI